MTNPHPNIVKLAKDLAYRKGKVLTLTTREHALLAKPEEIRTQKQAAEQVVAELSDKTRAFELDTIIPEHGYGEVKGYDAGKKVSGIKRHIAVGTQGLPHAVVVTTAEVTDRKGALLALCRCKPGLGRVQSLLADSGYVGRPLA